MSSKRLLALTVFVVAGSLSCSPSGNGGPCNQDLDCVRGEVCAQGSCRPSHFASCQSSAECPAGEFCPAGQCLPDCTQTGCAQGESCNTSTHLCDAVVQAPPQDQLAGSGGVAGGSSSSNSGNGSGTGNGGSGSGTVAAECGGAGMACCNGSICSSGLSCLNGSCQTTVSGSSSGSSSSTSTGSVGGSSSSGGGWTGGGSSSGGSSTSSGSSSSGGSSSGGGSSSAAQCTPDTWTNYASAFFQNNCVGCHSYFGTYSGVQGDSSRISSKISDGSMPPYGGLSASDQQRIVAWINCGMPQ